MKSKELSINEKRKLEEMTVKEIIQPILCDLIGKKQDKEARIYDIKISFKGIVVLDKIDYDAITVNGTVCNEKVTYEMWFDRNNGKFIIK